ncbi:hypothetical protein BBJ28_00019488 [Nothophytophthora sp. Chile5]|nr:hypothetical protein BBJ28_00019488 [Nothophytophthora sp. Chile5]
MPAVAKKLRVLCLHGFRTNTQVMLDQTKGLREALGDSAEFVFLNGAHEANGPSDVAIESRYAASKPFYEWCQIHLFDGEALTLDDDVAIAKDRAVDPPHGPEWSLLYTGLDQTLEYMDAKLRELGPFDVVVGFSQGAVLLTVLTMWYLQHQNVKWWKLAICVCGVRVSAINCRPLFVDEAGNDVLVPVPSIHIIGKQDVLFDESHKLADMWADHAPGWAMKKQVLEHDRGHKFPSGDRHRVFYEDLARAIRRQCQKEESSTASRL